MLALCSLVLVAPIGALAASLPSGSAAARPAKPAASGKVSTPATKPRAGARTGGSKAPTVVLYHVNRKETLRLRLQDDKGRPVRGVRQSVDRFLRCHYTNRRHSIDPRLIKLIYETGKHYPGRRIEVVSGYRHPKVAKNPRSPHMKGLACDMRVVGVKNTELRDFFRSRFQKVGVGYYPNSSFVHLDVRRGGSAFWIDYSGPGENALYSQNAAEDLKTGRADRWRRATIDPAWAETEDPADSLVESRVGSDAMFTAPNQSTVDPD